MIKLANQPPLEPLAGLQVPARLQEWHVRLAILGVQMRSLVR